MVSGLLILEITLLPSFRNFRITGICQDVKCQGDLRSNGIVFRIREICSKLKKDFFPSSPTGAARIRWSLWAPRSRGPAPTELELVSMLGLRDSSAGCGVLSLVLRELSGRSKTWMRQTSEVYLLLNWPCYTEEQSTKWFFWKSILPINTLKLTLGTK